MKKYRDLIALSFLTIVLFSCKKISGEGPVVTESRNVATFKEVRAAFAGDVFIKRDTMLTVRLEGQQNIIDELETKVSDGLLTIRVKSNVLLKSDAKVKVYISMPRIEGLYQSGSGSMQVNDVINSQNLFLKVTSSGHMYLSDLTVDELNATVSGSGSLHIDNGVVNKETLKISGSGDLDMENLKATTCDISVNGSGNGSVFVLGKLKVDISGSGNVYYKGRPSLDVSISGSGKLRGL